MWCYHHVGFGLTSVFLPFEGLECEANFLGLYWGERPFCSCDLCLAVAQLSLPLRLSLSLVPHLFRNGFQLTRCKCSLSFSCSDKYCLPVVVCSFARIFELSFEVAIFQIYLCRTFHPGISRFVPLSCIGALLLPSMFTIWKHLIYRESRA